MSDDDTQEAEMEQQMLKPCPFCGSDQVELSCWDYDGQGQHSFIRCTDCHCQGPLMEDDKYGENVDHLAIKLWNFRGMHPGYVTTRQDSPKEQGGDNGEDSESKPRRVYLPHQPDQNAKNSEG